MKLLHPYHLLVILLSFTSTSVAVLKFAKRGCKDTCGGMRIPFPFGIGANCSLNEWYIVDCNSSTPYLSTLNNLQVLDVDLGNQIVIVNMSTISNCNTNRSESISMDLGRSPFLYSKSHNNFVFQGCGNAFILDDERSVLTGCGTTSCPKHTTETINKCSYVSCCQTEIPQYLKSYSTRFYNEDGGCGSAFLLADNNYNHSYDAAWNVSNSFIPISLLWTLSERDYGEVSCCYYSNGRDNRKVDLGNGTGIDTWKCALRDSLYEGNPYLRRGCDYKASVIVKGPECAKCSDSGGYCNYEDVYDIDGLLYRQNNFTCYHEKSPYSYNESRSKSSFGIILGSCEG